MVLDPEASSEPLLGKNIGIHRHDVLETSGLGTLGAKLKGFGDLSLVDAIEQVAVVQEKAGPATLLQADFGEHQVEAEDLHVGDALTPLPIDMDVELRPTACLGDGEASGFLVEGFRQVLESQDRLAQDVVALVQVVPKRLGQIGPLNVQFGLGTLDTLCSLEALAQTLYLGLGTASLLAQVRVML